MAKATKAGIIAAFKPDTKEITVEAWNGSTVTIKKLTVAEKNEVDGTLLKDSNINDISDGGVQVSLGLMTKAAVMAVSYALVEPKFKVAELEALDSDAMAGVTEIKAALDEWDTPKKSKGVKGSSK